MNASSILSSKLTSSTQLDYKYAGFIDKISFNVFHLDLSTNSFKDRSNNCFTFKKEYTKKGHLHLSLYFNDRFTGTRIFYNKENIVRRITLNPSGYNTWDEFVLAISPLFSVVDLMVLDIGHVDYTVEIQKPFSEVIKGFIITNKAWISNYNSKSGKTTGIYFGAQDSNKCLVYDKKVLAKLAFECTRIEQSHLKNNLSYRNLNGLLRFVLDNNIKSKNPLEKSLLNTISLVNSKGQEERYLRTKYQLEVIPYMTFKKIHNKNGNFKRDFKKVINVTPNKTQPADILTIGLSKFFSHEDVL